MTKEDDSKNEGQGILMRLRRNKWWRRLTWTALILVVVAGLLIVFVSNHFFYLSHQRFGIWSHIQWKYQLSSNDERSGPQIIGHRGSGIDSTDSEAKDDNKLIGNTARAIQAAINAKVDWIEIDIRKTHDNKLVVFHDPNVAAKTNFDDLKGKTDFDDLKAEEDLNQGYLSGEVSALTLAQMQALTLKTYENEKILSLDEVFASFSSSKTQWIFDIKADGIDPQVLKWLKNKSIPKDQLLLFGDFDVLEDYKGSVYLLGYTTLFSKSLKTMLLDPSEMFDRCDKIGCELIVVPIFFVTKTFVDSAKEREIEVWCYDSNDERDHEYARGCGVTGVIVDNPMDITSKIKDLGK